jgi:hypothetical protein
MNKKTLEKYIHRDAYNEALFSSSIGVAQAFQKVIAKTDALSPSDKRLINDK